MSQYDQIQARLTAKTKTDNKRFNLSLKRSVYDRIMTHTESMTAETGVNVSAAALVTALLDDFEAKIAETAKKASK